MTWLSTLLFSCASQAILLSLLILSIQTRNRLANGFLSFFIALIALRMLMDFLVYIDAPFHPRFLLVYTLTILSGPILYFYVRALTEIEFRLTPQLAWHVAALLPPVIPAMYILLVTSLKPGVSNFDIMHDDYLPTQICAAAVMRGKTSW